MPNGSDSPCTINVGTLTLSSSGWRVFSGLPGGCTGNARHTTATASPAPDVRQATRAPEDRPPNTSGRSRNHSSDSASATVEPGRVELPGRCGSTPAGHPVGLLDQRDVHARLGGAAGGGHQVGRADATTGAVAE